MNIRQNKTKRMQNKKIGRKMEVVRRKKGGVVEAEVAVVKENLTENPKRNLRQLTNVKETRGMKHGSIHYFESDVSTRSLRKANTLKKRYSFPLIENDGEWAVFEFI